MRRAGLWISFAIGTCTECGEVRLVPRAGDRKACILTPGCKGRTVPEETPTPAQAAQRVVTGLFAVARAVMGSKRQLKVPKPRLPKEAPK
jgi:hypothetical protein